MFKKVSLLVLVAVLFSYVANAQSQTEGTKYEAWELGSQLSMAAILNAVGDPQANIDESLDIAKKNAGKFGIQLPPLPAKTTVRAENTRRFIDYVVEKGGDPIQKYLKANFSEEHAAAFDIGLATNIYSFLQIYGDVWQAESYPPLFLITIKHQTKAANLPVQTTDELVNLYGKNPTKEIVGKAAVNTTTNVSLYLMKREATEIGDRLAAQAKYAEAVIHYTKVIEFDPNFPEAYFNRGVAYYEIKEFDSAIADFTKFITFADKNSYVALRLQEAYGNRCVSYYYKKDFVRAENDCTAVINLKKDYVSPYYFRAQSRLAQDKLAEAIDDFTKVIELKPNAVTYYYRGVANQKIGKEELAELDFEKAESLEPGIVQKLNAKKEND